MKTEWTRCSCGHIALEHNKSGKCEECEKCGGYDGHSYQVSLFNKIYAGSPQMLEDIKTLTKK